MGYLPRPYAKFRKAFPKLDKAYDRLANQLHVAGPLDEKTRRLVKLGIAIGAHAEGAVKSHARRAMEMGATREEVLFVGDSPIDIQAARNASVEVVTLSHGFASEATLLEAKSDYVVRDFEELLRIAREKGW